MELNPWSSKACRSPRCRNSTCLGMIWKGQWDHPSRGHILSLPHTDHYLFPTPSQREKGSPVTMVMAALILWSPQRKDQTEQLLYFVVEKSEAFSCAKEKEGAAVPANVQWALPAHPRAHPGCLLLPDLSGPGLHAWSWGVQNCISDYGSALCSKGAGLPTRRRTDLGPGGISRKRL